MSKPYYLVLPSPKTLFINTVFALALGFLGPFGSYAMPMFERLAYWFIVFNLGYLVYSYTHKLTNWYFKDKNIHPVYLYIAPSLLAAIPLSVFVGFATKYLIGFSSVSLKYILIMFLQVLLLGIIIDVLMRLIHAKPEPKKNLTTAGQSFLNRLPDKIGTNLIFFVMEDHYLMVYTDIGNHMMLMRMKDALIELKDYDGMQVHRSYWIAINAITSIKKETRKTTLTMKNGMQVPVSRKYQSAINEVGLV